MKKPLKRLERIIDDFCDKGKTYKNLTPYEMKLLQELYYFEHLITFNTSVANAAKSIGFNVELDDNGINYEISLGDG